MKSSLFILQESFTPQVKNENEMDIMDTFVVLSSPGTTLKIS